MLRVRDVLSVTTDIPLRAKQETYSQVEIINFLLEEGRLDTQLPPNVISSLALRDQEFITWFQTYTSTQQRKLPVDEQKFREVAADLTRLSLIYNVNPQTEEAVEYLERLPNITLMLLDLLYLKREYVGIITDRILSRSVDIVHVMNISTTHYSKKDIERYLNDIFKRVVLAVIPNDPELARELMNYVDSTIQAMGPHPFRRGVPNIVSSMLELFDAISSRSLLESELDWLFSTYRGGAERAASYAVKRRSAESMAFFLRYLYQRGDIDPVKLLQNNDPGMEPRSYLTLITKIENIFAIQVDWTELIDYWKQLGNTQHISLIGMVFNDQV